MASSAPSTQTSMTPSQWSILATMSFLWGLSFIFVEMAVDALPPFTIVTFRVGVAGLILWVIVLARGLFIPSSPRAWATFLGMGLFNNALPFCLIVWGQKEVSAGLASILNAATPFFTVLVATIALSDEKASARKIIGIFIGFGGVAIMVGPDAAQAGGPPLPQLAILAASVCYAIGTVFSRKLNVSQYLPIVVAAGQVSMAALMLAPLALVIDQPFSLPMPSLTVWAALFGYAVLSTALAYILFFRLLATAGATNVTLVTFLVPIWAVWLGAAFLGEVLETRQFIGMLCIGIGLAAIDGRLWPNSKAK